MSSNSIKLLEGDAVKLNGRISLRARYVEHPPSYKYHDGYPKPKRYPIDKFSSLRDQEAALIQDLMYVLAGLEGYYVRYSEEYDVRKTASRLQGPDYLINRNIDASFKDIIKRVNRLGKMYFALCNFVEVYSDLIYGRMMQGLCYEMDQFLKEYETLLVELEREFHSNSKYSLTLVEQRLNRGSGLDSVSIFTKMQRFYEISQQINSENDKRASNVNFENLRFRNIMKSLKDDHYTGTLDGVTSDSANSRFVKGGMVLAVIQQSIDKYKGNGGVHDFLVGVFNRVSTCYLEMLNGWLQKGTVDDPYQEFLIDEAKDTNEDTKYDAMVWADKFTIRREGLPKQFYSKDIQKKVVLTGKYLNVIRECVGSDQIDNDDPVKQIESIQNSDLSLRIDEAYNRSNRLVLDLFFSGYGLDTWILCLNKYFLLTQCSGFEYFLKFAHIDLKKPTDRVSLTSITRSYKYSYEVTGSDVTEYEKLVHNLITPVISSDTFVNDLTLILKAQTTDADEVFAAESIDSLRELLRNTIERNDTELQSRLASPHTRIGKYAIQKFAIDVGIPFPLNLIITRSQVFEYQLIFREQALLRFVARSLEMSWYELSHNPMWRWKYTDKKLMHWVWRCRIVHRRMLDFVRLVMFYLNYHVVEVNWQRVEQVFNKIGKDEEVDLESVYSAFKAFLSMILSDSMLSKLRLLQVLTDLISVVLLLHSLVMSLPRTLVMMDQALYDGHSADFTEPLEAFDDAKNAERLSRLNKTLSSYSTAFDVKLGEFASMLRYYGELDSSSLLTLYKDLVSAFNITE